MQIFFRTAILTVLFACTGCAIHPAPENLSGVPTYIIVRQLRCEARQAIIDSAIGWLIAEQNEDRVDKASRDIGLQFARNERAIHELRPELFKGRVAAIVEVFFDTGVASFFELEMTEVNNVGTDVNLLKPFTESKAKLGIKAGYNRQRVNNRTFTVTDKFSSLVRLPPDYCAGTDRGVPYNYVVAENYAYPIAGKIGIQQQIRDFVELTLFGNLGGKKDAPSGPPTLVDALAFQTEVTGTLSPSVTFSPVGAGLSVTDASLTGVATRKDLHKVTMGLAIGGAGIKRVAPLRQMLFAMPLATPATSGSSIDRALDAVNQSLTLRLFRPTINLVQ